MRTRPMVWDLFSGQGGAARGYIAAGFDVIGVDNQGSVAKYYPGECWTGEWREVTGYLRRLYGDPDLVHASPPCQLYSITNAARQASYPDLIGPVRDYLTEWGVPFVIENVERAPLVDAVTLCGTMFALATRDDDGEMLYLKRHRLFEAHGFTIDQPRCDCALAEKLGYRCAGVYGGGRTDKVEAREVRHGGYTPASKAIRAKLMGVDPADFTLAGLSQAIPPAYSKWVGRQFLARQERVA